MYSNVHGGYCVPGVMYDVYYLSCGVVGYMSVICHYKHRFDCRGGAVLKHGYYPTFSIVENEQSLEITGFISRNKGDKSNMYRLGSRDGKFGMHIGSDWPQMRQIWDFLRSVSVHFGSASQICHPVGV